jgi:hypothetical protein
MDLTIFLKTARLERHGDSALQGAIEVICLLGRFASASDLRLIREKSVFVLLFSSIARWKHGTVSEMCVFCFIRTAMHQRSVLYCNEMQMMKLLCR